jgi:hypothetical protein
MDENILGLARKRCASGGGYARTSQIGNAMFFSLQPAIIDQKVVATVPTE